MDAGTKLQLTQAQVAKLIDYTNRIPQEVIPHITGWDDIYILHGTESLDFPMYFIHPDGMDLNDFLRELLEVGGATHVAHFEWAGDAWQWSVDVDMAMVKNTGAQVVEPQSAATALLQFNRKIAAELQHGDLTTLTLHGASRGLDLQQSTDGPDIDREINHTWKVDEIETYHFTRIVRRNNNLTVYGAVTYNHLPAGNRIWTRARDSQEWIGHLTVGAETWTIADDPMIATLNDLFITHLTDGPDMDETFGYEVNWTSGGETYTFTRIQRTNNNLRVEAKAPDGVIIVFERDDHNLHRWTATPEKDFPYYVGNTDMIIRLNHFFTAE